MSNKSHFFRQSSGGGSDAFIAIFRTTSANESITLPYISNGTYSGTIDWGDGTVVANTYANRTHTYVNSGDYDITVLGALVGFSGATNKLRLILNFGNGFVIDNNTKFTGCGFLDILATDTPIIIATSLINFFSGCGALIYNESVNNWDVSTVNDLTSCFQNTFKFNFSINNWDVSNVNTMFRVFINSIYNKPLNNWDVSNVFNFQQMFRSNKSFNQPLNNWNLSTSLNVNMFRMFRGADSFNQDLSDWNFSSLVSLSQFMTEKTHLNYDATYYDNLLIKWASDPSLGGIPNNKNLVIDMGTIKYTTNGASARATILANNKATQIIDGGQI